MTFHEILNMYIEALGCTAKDISDRSGLSAASLSRYRKGERLPDPASPSFDNLVRALAEMAAEKAAKTQADRQKKCAASAEETVKAETITDAHTPTDTTAPAEAADRDAAPLTADEIRDSFLGASDMATIDTKQLLAHFDKLVSVLDISITRLCRQINYDSSAVFRFRNGTRRPADPEKFASAVAGYVAREMTTPQHLSILADLLACDTTALADSAHRFEKLNHWLLSDGGEQETSVSNFLSKLDEFDLNEYIKAIHFDELKVPTMPFQLPTSRFYTGLQEMMESELDFLKATVLAKSMEPVIMYSDMPMKEMSEDPEFPKKWIFGMALMLKKGLHLNMIHNIDRSFDEMMLGLESFIPMYMTGQISPYYLKGRQNGVFHHFLKVSGAAALSGEAIAGYHAKGRYYLTKSKKELAYFTERAQELLANATPLMDIYRSENAADFRAFLRTGAEKGGKRRGILSTLPIYTIEPSLLEAMLRRHDVPEDEISVILTRAAACRALVETILESHVMEDELSEINENEFAESPQPLDLSFAFCEREIYYTYEEYQAHLESAKAFMTTHPNYTLVLTAAHTFRNLQILIHEGKWAMVSKAKAPAIHFVIHHPRLRQAIEQFVPPLVDGPDAEDA
ncbi:MAG: helix-turn-helix transcriptional regulator [Lachnospiraceae bacterium]|nr:helix-turn-helix transcriptional regulator [Lachnospiraceae bacterium]